MSDGESSSSEDIPLAALGKKRGGESSDDEEFDFDDDDSDGDTEQDEIEGEEPDSDNFIVEDSEEDGNEDEDYTSDSSGDAPLTSLKSKKKAPPPKKVTAKPLNKKAAAKRKTTQKKKKTKKEKRTASKKIIPSSMGNYLCPSGELYSNCDKGKLIQSLLARWWYAYKWPDPSSYEEPTPSGYDALDGFPGVYICTDGSEVGKILDRRDHAKSPSFNNFAKKDSEELRKLLVRAIDEQMKELVRHEGEGTTTQKSLKVMQKWAVKLNCAKADKEAVRVLKAKRLALS